MKMPLEWHEKCLVHWKESLINDVDMVARLVKKIERDRAEIEIYEAQIKRATELGKTEFDDEKFNLPKKKKKG